MSDTSITPNIEVTIGRQNSHGLANNVQERLNCPSICRARAEKH